MPTSKEEMLRRGLPLHDTQHNQHRRAQWQDYSDTGLYMVTICIEGRRGLFGYLEGDIRAQRASKAFPHIVLTPLGRAIMEEELPKIHRYYPQVELWQAAIMPDHLHLLFYIREPLPPGKHLGHIISSFKGGCSRAWWAITAAGITAAGITAAGITAANAAGTAAGAGTAAPAVVHAASAAVKGAAVKGAAVTGAPLFEQGYHDRIIKRPGMLENIKRYMADNPLRALMRRQLPQLMERQLHLRIGAHEYAAFGALFLLKRAEKERVFYHRRDKDTGIATELTEAYRQAHDRQLCEAREGVVLVSPSISRGEKLVIDAAIDERLPVIQLQKEPIERYWKPELRRFEACACGQLLILYPKEMEGLDSDYARFHRLNELAAEICDSTDAVLLGLGDLT